jgi:hypothetical protein
MRTFIVSFAIGLLLVSARAELLQMEVNGIANQPGKSSQPGFTVLLIDVKDQESLISGLLSVPDEFGEIEACVLIIMQPDGKKIGRVVMGAQILHKWKKDFEFNLPKSLLEKSLIQVSHRKGDDLHIAKIPLGTFPIQPPKIGG